MQSVIYEVRTIGVIDSTSRCPSHSCRNVRILLESTGMRLDSRGITVFLQEWNILNKIVYIYICLHLLNIFLYLYLLIYLYLFKLYYLVHFNIKNLHGLETRGNTSRALFFHVSPLLPCHTHSQLQIISKYQLTQLRNNKKCTRDSRRVMSQVPIHSGLFSGLVTPICLHKELTRAQDVRWHISSPFYLHLLHLLQFHSLYLSIYKYQLVQ